jgi:enterochelin esterase-like enzyme
MLMGFDSDRAQLISSLLVAGVAAGAATLVTDRRGRATVAGLTGFAAIFAPTLIRETGDALASNGVNGSFDPFGWSQTLLALLAAGAVSSWAGAALAQTLRPGLIDAGAAVRDVIRGRRLERSRLRSPVTVAFVLILLVAALPVFDDMVNYTPDARMLHGGAPLPGLIPAVSTGSATPAAGSPSPRGSTSATTRQTAPRPTGSSRADTRPWLSLRPTGGGSVVAVPLPAPWKDGSATTNEIGIYTPPGYDPRATRRYPVLYEAPFQYALWDSSLNVKVALDTLIDRGVIPPMIVVFIGTSHSPIPDTECANSVDGRVWMDTFISKTAIPYVDSHYLTIARPEARATTGFSQGGYCAAILVLRHPSVFGTAISFSGYFVAGGIDGSARAPFRGSRAALAAASPLVVAAHLPLAARAGLYFIVVAKLSQPLYGFQAAQFEKALATNGYGYASIDTRMPHGWNQVRQYLPGALEDWAAHMVSAGVF